MEQLQRKRVDEQKVISILHTGSYDEIGQVHRDLREWASEHNAETTGQAITVFLSAPDEFDARSAMFEVCIPVVGHISGDDEVTVKNVPAVMVAFTTVECSYEEMPARYSEMLAWLSVQGMAVAGPAREVYINPPRSQDDVSNEKRVVEMQFPISE